MSIDFTKSNRDYKTLQPMAQQAYLIFMKECKEQGLEVFPTDFLRTIERQYYLLCQGRTPQQSIAMGVNVEFANKYANPKGNQVTWTLNSNHREGLAWDIACSPPNNLYDEKTLARCGDIAKKLGLIWGGSWKNKDSPHIEMPKNWKAPVKTPTYTITKVKMDLFGETKMIDSINIDNTNHIKLRDLNCSKIKVEWKNNSVYVNGNVFKVDGILYQDNNYVKIRSLEQIGINVVWDNAKKTIVIK